MTPVPYEDVLGPEPAASGVVRVTAATVEARDVTFLDADGRIPDGMLSLLVGEPGLGKSTYLYGLAARVSRAGGHVLFATAEDPLHEVWRPRLEAAGADLGRAHYLKLANGRQDERGLVLPDDVKALARDLKSNPVRLLVVDPLGAHLSAHTSAHVDASVRQALAPLARVADKHRCAVVGVAHLNKNTAAAGLARVGGSVAFGAAARSVLVWGCDPDHEPTDLRRVLGHLKCNVGPRTGSEAHVIETVTLAGDITTSKTTFAGDSPHSAEDLLNGQAGDVRAFLEDVLADGPRSTKDVIAEAKDVGLTGSQIKRARKALGVKTHRVGGLGSDGCWVMELPTGQIGDESAKGSKGPSRPDSPLSEIPAQIASVHGNGWRPHLPDENAPDWWPS
jgi:hypothetical protein